MNANWKNIIKAEAYAANLPQHMLLDPAKITATIMAIYGLDRMQAEEIVDFEIEKHFETELS